MNWHDYWSGEIGEKRIAILKGAWGKTSTAKIADAIGKKHAPAPTRNAVIGKAHRLGLRRLKKPAHRGPLEFRRASPLLGAHR